MKVAVVIPAFNASPSLFELLTRSFQFVPPEDIIVVDDGSIDRTSQIARDCGVECIRHRSNQGKGAALQTGFREVLNHHYNALITMDADLQHQPEMIPRFIETFSKHRSDIIIGSRMENISGMPFMRKISNRLTTFLVESRTGKKVFDSQSGFRLISRSVVEQIDIHHSGYSAETELLVKAAQKGFSIEAIPIPTIYAGEKSYMTHVSTTLNFIRVLVKDY